MKTQDKDQIGTYVEGLIDIAPRPKPTLASRMRYQRALLREVLMFWPDVNPTDIVAEVISPLVQRHLA